MAAPARTATERERDLVIVAEMYCARATQAQIAAHFGLSQSVISRDIAAVVRRWQADVNKKITVQKARELAAIDGLERDYRAAWQRSCRPRERTTNGKIDGQTPRPKVSYQSVKEHRDGNPAFLAGIAWCIERRIKLLGLDKPTEVTVSVRDQRERVRADAEREGLDADLAVAEFERILKNGAR